MAVITPQQVLTKIPPFSAWTDYTPTVPKLYWDVYSQEERLKAIIEMLDKVVSYANKMADELNLTEEQLAELNKLFEQFKESGFLDYYEKQLEAWINENMPGIISKAIKFVFFGLTEDGYFYADIPDSWDGITFDTIMVYGFPEYGHLILEY